MKNLVETLLAAQPLLLRAGHNLPEQQATLERLRAHVPAPVLAHFLRLVSRGNKGAAEMRNGLCTSCHIRVASGVAAALVHPTDLHLCESCGAYLVLPADEKPVAAAVARLMPKAASVKKRQMKTEPELVAV